MVFFILILLLYFWVFYFFQPKPIPKPTGRGPDAPDPFVLTFTAKNPHTFQFLGNAFQWQHSPTGYSVDPDRIVERDDCYPYAAPMTIPASGLSLYRYLRHHPDLDTLTTTFHESPYFVQQGTPFYFTCLNRRITGLDLCPSGTLFQNQACVDASACTDQPDGHLLPFLSDNHKYIECSNGQEVVKTCPNADEFFYLNQCFAKTDFIHYCQFYETVAPFIMDEKTLFECVDSKPILTVCDPGTRLFDQLVCEPDQCVGQLNGTRLPMKERQVDPFHFVPGYVECWNDRVVDTVECPSTWNPHLSGGDNLTHLPMVFDGQQCAVPSFCETVHSRDPEVLVPVHEFTKRVQNWKRSEALDRSAGYSCHAGQKRKRPIPPGQRIGKRYKREWACDTPTTLVPFLHGPNQYYDCSQQQVVLCPVDHFFDGATCQPIPKHAFEFHGVPLFQFDSLNTEAWIGAWDTKGPTKVLEQDCLNAHLDFSRLYDLCYHPECQPYMFLSMIPDFTLFLPGGGHQCRMDEKTRHLVKEPVEWQATFWSQSTLNPTDTCTFGQSLQTGHFVWDSTIFATCDRTHPFVFCPSPYTQGLLRENGVYACRPPDEDRVAHTDLDVYVQYTMNEIQQIMPPVWDNQPYQFNLSRGDKTLYTLHEKGFTIPPKTRLKLKINRPVNLVLKYRVTHPPNIALKYTLPNDRELLVSDPDRAFHVSNEIFAAYPMDFPRYTVHSHVVD